MTTMNEERTRQLDALQHMEAYAFRKQTEIPEIRATAVSMEHRKTGARVFLLLCDDRNKVFTIGFRTPPSDSTGVAHIVEHTVLCGSEKYPAKDPFVELAKGSLNTFLNAMTYPDKTIYPVASCNDKDFRNLMDVYLDAVFHPKLYREEKIFRQEGWHYEATSPDGPLTLNGVVYNEMKGVYSSPDGVLERAVNEALFPGHPYGEESGGDPERIPELSYEAYLDFHRRYYHPTNSFLYLYGNADMAKQLQYIDEAYLSAYEKRPLDSEIQEPEPLRGMVRKECAYSIAESESEAGASYLSLNIRVGCELDPLRCNAFQVLEAVLLDVPGAPLHDRLIAAGIGEDIYGGYNYGIRDPYFAITAKNTDPEQEAAFLSVTQETLRELANGALDHDMLRAAINVAEFRAREANFGSYPKGLIYGMECFNSWLYEEDPCMYLQFDAMFAELKKKVDENFFEELIRTFLLNDQNAALVILKPVRGLTAKKEEALRETLAAQAAAMTPEERMQIVRETEALKAYQKAPSDREDLLKIPQLSRSDIGTKAEKPVYEERELAGLPVVWSNLFTSGILYLRVFFDCSHLTLEENSCLALYRDLLGYLDTESHRYGALSTLINLNSGGISFGMEAYPDLLRYGPDTRVFYADAKVLPERAGFALETVREMLMTTSLSDRERLKGRLQEIRAGLKDGLTAAGHSAALGRAGACVSESAAFGDAIKGIAYYRFLEALSEDDQGQMEAFVRRIAEITTGLFTGDNLRIHVTCDETSLAAVSDALEGYREQFPETAERVPRFDWKREIRSEAFESASQVNYVARAGNFREKGFSYTGVLRVLKTLLSYDYLWNHVRVLGGAYGCGASFARSGYGGFASFRDPNLTETDRVYEGIAAYAGSFQADEREMTKSILGAVAEMDTPLPPMQRGLRGLSACCSGLDAEALQRERDEILGAEPADIQALAPLLDAILSDRAKCAIGNEKQIEAARACFTAVMPLVRQKKEET